MHVTPGEKRAAWCLVPILIGFLPPVTTWAAAVETRPLGVPFLLFWNCLMIVITALAMTLAFAIKIRVDGE
jgi:hypothetical protein